jgi:hypothetical protein
LITQDGRATRRESTQRTTHPDSGEPGIEWQVTGPMRLGHADRM